MKPLRRPAWLFVLLCAAGLASAADGVTDTEVLLGERSAFSGPSVGLGVELWRGAHAAFEEANARGGVHGRKIRVVLADDQYDAEKAGPAALELLSRRQVFALFGGVGTPTLQKALPLILKFHRTNGVFQFSNFTGAQPQRERPYDQVVFNVRASYRQETQAMVDAFVASGRRRIGLFVQDDSYGASGRDGVTRALQGHGLKVAADTTYARGQKYEVSTAAQLKLLKAANVDAIIAVGAYQACAALIRDVRRSGWDVPIHNVSFVGADQLLTLLKQESDPRVIEHLLITQVVPSYDDAAIPLVRDYRAAMDRFRPSTPERVGDTPYSDRYRPSSAYSFGSLEGYLNARVFLAVLEKTGRNLSRASFYAAAESMGPMDLGLGEVKAELSAARHQALDKVWFTRATPAGWVAVPDVSKVLR